MKKNKLKPYKTFEDLLRAKKIAEKQETLDEEIYYETPPITKKELKKIPKKK